MPGLEEVPGWSLDSSPSLASSGMLLCLLLLPVVWGEKLQQEAAFSLNVPETVTVQEYLCVQIPCNFSFHGKNKPNNIFFSWFWNKKKSTNLVATNNSQRNVSVNFRNRFKIGNFSNHNCSLIIRNAQKFDAGNYIISVDRGKSKPDFEKKVFVNVSDLTQKPDIQVPKTLKSGDQETLICKMPEVCVDSSHTFLWIGSALSSQNPAARILTSSKLSFIPKPQDHGTNITCRVTFKRSCLTSERTVQLRVIYPPETPTIQVHQGKWTVLKFLKNESYLPVLEGQSLSLSCTTDSYPAVSLNWTKGKQILTSSQLSAAGLVSLQLPQVGPGDSGEYICQTEDPLESKKASLVISVQYPPKVLNSSCSWTEEGLLCTCSVQAEPTPSLYWWLGDNPIQGNSSNNTFQMVSTTSGCWTNSSLSLRQKPDPAFSLRCEGKNHHGTQSLSILLVPDRTTPDTEMNIKTYILGISCGAFVIGFLSFCLLILLKIRKRKSTAMRTKASKTEINVGDKHLPSEAIPLNPDRILRSKQALRPVSHRIASPTSEEDPELHYACLSFQNPKTPSPQQSTYTGTEYAEIKF
ncbi:SIGLEC family-like protein 1 [Antechinus flavipes]|uniref:SIGLEC family-like protein 1 n=1 Tax=Antechinus flavipes TaxID=38775 RepID=UPI0022357504|nr:SIGLEC family-like protein 1 [Antechinus flavipes]